MQIRFRPPSLLPLMLLISVAGPARAQVIDRYFPATASRC